MTAKVEKKREFLINILFLAVILALVYVFFKYLFWVTAPFILTFFFAVLLQRPIRWLDKKTNNKCHTLWSILLVILSILVVIVPLAFLLSALISKVFDLFKVIGNSLNDIPTFLTTLENKLLEIGKFLPDAIYKSYSSTITNWIDSLITTDKVAVLDFDTIKNSISTGFSGVYGVVKSVPGILIGVVIGVIAWIFFTKDYNYIVRFIQKQLPQNKKNVLVEIKQVFSQTILKMVRAYSLIMFITFCELFLGFTILKVAGVLTTSYYIWIAVGTAIFDILPVAGSGGVLIPWAIVSLVMGNVKLAIGLIIVYAVITVIRQYIEPKIVGNSLGVHPLITLMGLYFGLKLFGFLGMFVVPITVMTLKAFNDTGRISLWKTVERN